MLRFLFLHVYLTAVKKIPSLRLRVEYNFKSNKIFHIVLAKVGGADEIRTHDLFRAKEALSQLSHSPIYIAAVLLYHHIYSGSMKMQERQMPEHVITGLEILLSENINDLKCSNVAVLANQTSVTDQFTHIVDALFSEGIDIETIFTPEHGLRGSAANGEEVGDEVDTKTGKPVKSLYGSSKALTPESLSNVNIMLIDLQDVGSRFYTYASTMAEVMARCGELGVEVWVLDRPNPISGKNPEGPMLEDEFKSFVGFVPSPIRHALTMGEIAILLAKYAGCECDLRIIKMRGWKREIPGPCYRKRRLFPGEKEGKVGQG